MATSKLHSDMKNYNSSNGYYIILFMHGIMTSNHSACDEMLLCMYRGLDSEPPNTVVVFALKLNITMSTLIK